jgi:hypothetical protein
MQLLKTLNCNMENPYLIWDNRTRAELTKYLEEEQQSTIRTVCLSLTGNVMSLSNLLLQGMYMSLSNLLLQGMYIRGIANCIWPL